MFIQCNISIGSIQSAKLTFTKQNESSSVPSVWIASSIGLPLVHLVLSSMGTLVIPLLWQLFSSLMTTGTSRGLRAMATEDENPRWRSRCWENLLIGLWVYYQAPSASSYDGEIQLLLSFEIAYFRTIGSSCVAILQVYCWCYGSVKFIGRRDDRAYRQQTVIHCIYIYSKIHNNM